MRGLPLRVPRLALYPAGLCVPSHLCGVQCKRDSIQGGGRTEHRRDGKKRREARPQPMPSATGPRTQRQHRSRGAWVFLRFRRSEAAAGGDRPRSEILAAREIESEQPNFLDISALRTRRAGGTPGPRPGGTPEEISRGQVRLRGRRPRTPCRLAPCPKRGIEENGPRRRGVAERLRGRRRQKLLRCPAGAWPVRRRNRGPRPRSGLAPG